MPTTALRMLLPTETVAVAVSRHKQAVEMRNLGRVCVGLGQPSAIHALRLGGGDPERRPWRGATGRSSGLGRDVDIFARTVPEPGLRRPSRVVVGNWAIAGRGRRRQECDRQRRERGYRVPRPPSPSGEGHTMCIVPTPGHGNQSTKSSQHHHIFGARAPGYALPYS
jgi:hypothetical protein